MEVSGQLHAPAALPPRKEPQYPLDRKLGGPQSRPGRDGEEKISCLFRESNPGRPASSYTNWAILDPERVGRGPISCINPVFVCSDWGRPQKVLVRTAGLRIEIWTREHKCDERDRDIRFPQSQKVIRFIMTTDQVVRFREEFRPRLYYSWNVTTSWWTDDPFFQHASVPAVAVQRGPAMRKSVVCLTVNVGTARTFR
jgi:hypothetical protein